MKDKPKILVVDDDERNLRLFSAFLAPMEYVVSIAHDGIEALEKVKEISPDIILLDIMMPKMDGFEVCKRLKADIKTSDIPIIFITAKTQTDDIVKGFELGAADYVTKPFYQAELFARVKTHVDLKISRSKVKDQYEKLKYLEIMRESLTQMIVHDLRNPLAGLKGYFDLLSMNPVVKDDEKASRSVKIIDMNIKVLIDMITAILDLSKLEAGEMIIKKTMLNLNELLDNVEHGIEPLLKRRNIEFTQIYPDNLNEIVADREILRRIFVNIISNSIKFSPQNGKIILSIEEKEVNLIFSLKDEGPGIPEEYQRKIFEKFGQVETQQKGIKYSTGLGLAFCKMAVEAHGGNIGVISDGKNGSTFWFSLSI